MTAKGSRHAFGMAKARVRSVPTGVRMSALHYKTNSRITSRIISLELVVDYQPDYHLNYQPDYQPGSTEVPAW